MEIWWNQFLCMCMIQVPGKFLIYMWRKWEGWFINQEITEGLDFDPTSPLLSIHLFISSVFPSDVPGGFSVNQQEEPMEGGDLHLTCVANKYLYTMLSWQRVKGTDTQSWSSAPSNQQLISGEFSNSLVLLLSNLTARDSGAYRCSARHLVTRQEIHLDTQVVVKSEYSVSFLVCATKRNICTKS